MIVQNYWFTTLLEKNYILCPPLTKNITCDVLIIGGGMSGVSCAMGFLDKELKVVLLEKNILGGSSSSRSAGFLTPDSELELSQLVRRYGIKGARELWEVPVKGIDLIKNNVKKYNLDCDLRTQDSLFLGIGESGWQDVRDEQDCRHKVGFTNQEIFNQSQLQKKISSVGFNGAISYNDTYGINPLQYLQGIKSILLDNQISIYENTEVKKIENNIAFTHAGTVTANQIVIAIDKMQNSFNPLAKEVFHAQTFLSISEPLSDKEINTLFPDNKEYQMWDSTLVYSYWRLINGNRLLLGGGNAITTFLPNAWYHENVIKAVHKRFKSHFPYLANLEFTQYWPGLIDTTRDLLPTIVKNPNNNSMHFIMGVVGLPWASFCGNFVAENILGTATVEYNKYYEYFTDRRYFVFPTWLQNVVGKPALFALNNAWAKYYQVDKNHLPKKTKNEF